MATILVYSDGNVGASSNCVAMTVASLKKAISGQQATVRTTTSEELVSSKWRENCRLLVLPGGRDLPYCKELNGAGNEQISAYIQEGGSYLGICAGAYFASAYVEFARGDPKMAVVGPRELALFPVTARGPVFPAFSYKTNSGAHAAGANLTAAGASTLGGTEGENATLFYNGGCGFIYREGAGSTSYEALMTYTGHSEPESPQPSPYANTAAIIGGRVGKGQAILTGLHFEASTDLLKKYYEGDEYVTPLLPTLEQNEARRLSLFNACINYLTNNNY